MQQRFDAPYEVKELEANGVFSGYASVFDIEDHYGDIIAPGAFKKSLSALKKKKRTPAMLWQHKTDEPIGVWTDFQEDDSGLLASGQLVLDTQRGAEAYALLKAGAITGLSIGFNAVNSKVDKDSGKRILTEIDLWETSLVTFPANEKARIGSVRAALNEGRLPTSRELEEVLRDEGLSSKQAKEIISHGLAAAGLRDEVDDSVRYAAEELLLKVVSLRRS